jgi:hypothetical protein
MCPVRSVTYVSGRSLSIFSIAYAASAGFGFLSAVFSTFGTYNSGQLESAIRMSKHQCAGANAALVIVLAVPP